MVAKKKIRNIAIIAHVDHGKTTFVDSFLKQSGTFKDHQVMTERVLDCNPLEAKKGITILAKCTSIEWKDHQINILDTPGHADFRAEVQRVLQLTEGVILLVDAKEGIMPQTEFVFKEAAKLGLKVILVVNKIDSPLADPKNVADNTLEFMANVDENYIESPVFYGSGRDGYASKILENAKAAGNMFEVLNEIISYIPEPKTNGEDFQLLTSIVLVDEYFGRLLVGKIYGGSIKAGDSVISINQNGEIVESFRVNKLFGFSGIQRVEIDNASEGMIIALAGAKESIVTHTLVKNPKTLPITAPLIEEPTLSVIFITNPLPTIGKDGKKVTSRQIQERLVTESQTNVGIKLKINGEQFEVFGRGELQIAILAEQMRQEGFEFAIKNPKVILKTDNGITTEPYEIVMFNVSLDHQNLISGIQNAMERRKGLAIDFTSTEKETVLKFKIAAKNLIGFLNEFNSLTRGQVVMNKQFAGYEPYKATDNFVENGVLVSMETGFTTAFALDNLKSRGKFYVDPSEMVYKDMVIGEYNKPGRLDINPVKTKPLTNIRAPMADDKVKLAPAIKMDLSDQIFFQNKDFVVITPNSCVMILRQK